MSIYRQINIKLIFQRIHVSHDFDLVVAVCPYIYAIIKHISYIILRTKHGFRYKVGGCNSPRGVRLKCYYAFFLVCCVCDTSYIVSVHVQCQASIYTLWLCRGHSWRVRLAKQETLTPPGHLVSTLVRRGP